MLKPKTKNPKLQYLYIQIKKFVCINIEVLGCISTITMRFIIFEMEKSSAHFKEYN